MKRELDHWPVGLFVLLFALLFTAGCAKEHGNRIDRGERIVIRAVMPATEDADTKLSYEEQVDLSDPALVTMKPIWKAGDQVRVYDDLEQVASDFVLTDGFGSKTGVFEGNHPGGLSDVLQAVFPSRAHPGGQWAEMELSVAGQAQSGDGNTAHLSDYHYMTGSLSLQARAGGGAGRQGVVDFSHRVAFFKFVLTLPGTDAFTPSKISVVTTDASIPVSVLAADGSAVTRDDRLELGLSNIALDAQNRTVTAYMAVLPFAPGAEMLSVRITDGAKTYDYTNMVSVGKTYEAGKVYTFILNNAQLIDMDRRAALFTDATLAADSYAQGEGSEQSPYEIASAEEFKKFVTDVNAGTATPGFYKLTTDIHVTASHWIPIGNEENMFYRSFDGDGKNVTGQLRGGDENFGLFGVSNGHIRNLNVSAAVICTAEKGTPSGNSPARLYLGGIVALQKGGDIENCSFSGRIMFENVLENTNGFIGGIVAWAGAPISNIQNCRNHGAITFPSGVKSDESGFLYTVTGGGIAAVCAGKISACLNTGGLTGGDNPAGGQAGGIAGQALNAISGCENRGDIRLARSARAGGIAGYARSDYGDTAYSGNSNSGEIVAPGREVGGIFGRLFSKAGVTATLSDNVHTGAAPAGIIVGICDLNGGTIVVDGEPVPASGQPWPYAP